MCRTDFWTLWEKVRVGWSERTSSKHVYYQVWNRSLVQVWCMKQMLAAGALGWPRGMVWGGKWEGSSGWGTHVNPWLIHVNVWQKKTLQYCKVISLQLIKINEGGKKWALQKKKKERKKSISIYFMWLVSGLLSVSRMITQVTVLKAFHQCAAWPHIYHPCLTFPKNLLLSLKGFHYPQLQKQCLFSL